MRLWKQYRHIIVFSAYLCQIFFIYKAIQLLPLGGHQLKLPLDDSIPLIPIFILPYYLFGIVIFLPFLFSWKSKDTFYKVSLSFFWTSSIANLIYLVYPTYVLRPDIDGNDLLSAMIRFIYFVDGPTNLFPSGHVAFSLLANLVIFEMHKKTALWMLPLTFFIVVSTVFVKQHYTLDILGGIVLALLVYAAIWKNHP